MPDISMCMNQGCPRFYACYRAQAEPNQIRQSYSSFRYQMTNNGAICDHFIPLRPVEITP